MLLFISLLWNTSAQRGNSTKMWQYCVFPLLPLFHISSGMVYSRRGENPCDAAWRMWVTVGQISRYLTSSPFVMDNLGPVQHVAIWLIWFTLRETGGGKQQEFPGEHPRRMENMVYTVQTENTFRIWTVSLWYSRPMDEGLSLCFFMLLSMPLWF